MNQNPSTIDDLRARIRALEGGFGEPRLRSHVPTGIAALDRRLAGGGLPAGAFVALLAAGAAAEMPWALATLLAAAVLRFVAALREAPPGDRPGIRGDEAVLVDRAAELYPPGLAALGLPLERTLLVRPGRARDAPWAFAEALRSRAVAVAVGEVVRLGPADVTRLLQAAEEGGGIGIALAREVEAGVLERAPVVMRVRSLPHVEGSGPCRGPRLGVSVVRSRGRAAVEGEEIEIHVSSNLVSDAARAADGHCLPGPTRVAG